MKRLDVSEVLCYRKKPVGRGTVRRHYLAWRESQGIPVRCDEEHCIFHTQPLEWSGKRLTLILDHKNGNNSDNRPKNLRLLCPNCDSQLEETRGGANIGRVEKSEGGFALVSKKDGKRAYFLPVEPATIVVSGQPARLVLRKNKDKAIGEA